MTQNGLWGGRNQTSGTGCWGYVHMCAGMPEELTEDVWFTRLSHSQPVSPISDNYLCQINYQFKCQPEDVDEIHPDYLDELTKWVLGLMFGACGCKECPMSSSIISHHLSLYAHLKGFSFHHSPSVWTHSWLLHSTFGAVSSGYTVWRRWCSIVFISCILLIYQHGHQRPDGREIALSESTELTFRV